jgi:predicted lactoylglutathione lyase
MSQTQKSILDLTFISHGTLECSNIENTRAFYEDFFGFECVQTSKISIWCRLKESKHIYVCVEVKDRDAKMAFTNHNGLDVAKDEDVDGCYEKVVDNAQKWGITDITKPRIQHGSYSFYFYDLDGNCWEILSNPAGGYSWMFERGNQEGMGHMKRSFNRPDLKV